VTAVFVDTSALIAFVDGDDPRSTDVRDAFVAHRRDDLVTHGYVVAETLAVARRRFGVGTTTALIDGALPLLRLLPVDEELFTAAISTYRASLPSSISLVDRISLGVIRRELIEQVLALDPDLGSPGTSLLP
jgi:predicted nucleic acid-binding protein